MMRHSAKTLYYFLLFWMISASLWAQEEIRSFSLQEAKEYAKKNNYDVQKAKLAIDVANKQKWQVIATGFPQVSISASMSKLIDIPTQLIPGEFFGEDPGTYIPVQFGVPYNASYGISATQLIFSGSYIVGLQASRTFLQLSEQAHKKSQIDIGETITQSYFLVLMAEENEKVLTTSLENITRTYDEISELNKEGFVEATDVSQMQISVNQLENQLNSVKQQIDVAYKLLKLQLGIELETPIALTDSLTQLLRTEQIGERLQREFHVQDNIGFKLLVTQEELADLTLKNEYSTFLPNVAAFASIEKNAQRNEFNFFDTSQPWYKTTMVEISPG